MYIKIYYIFGNIFDRHLTKYIYVCVCVCVYVYIYIYVWIIVGEESEKVGLKLNIQNTKIMASGPITSWKIDGEAVETVSDFILGGSKITADGDCSH